MIVPGSSSQLLAATLAEETGRPLATPTYDRFPDGEGLAAVPDFDDDEATIVAATDSDAAWVELLQLQDAVREAGAERVTTVIPYMGYARQDESFGDGQPVSARAMARAVSTGTDRVVLVNPHEAGVADFYDVPVETVDAASVLAEPLRPTSRTRCSSRPTRARSASPRRSGTRTAPARPTISRSTATATRARSRCRRRTPTSRDGTWSSSTTSSPPGQR